MKGAEAWGAVAGAAAALGALAEAAAVVLDAEVVLGKLGKLGKS